MVDILLHLHQYVPAHTFSKSIVVGTREPFDMTDAVLQKVSLNKDPSHKGYLCVMQVLLGGDQLTAARIRGAQRARSNCLTTTSRLEGVEATSADFHVKLNLLDASLFK